MKNIFKIHILYYIVAIITILTGFFHDFILLSLIIFVHEMGHILIARYFKWHIEKVVIFPFGGITIFREYLNRPIKEEFLITIFGPIFQILFYFTMCLMNLDTEIFTYYHYALLIFNLFPIFPLDGSKIVMLLFQKYFPYYLSNLCSLILSFIILFSSFVYLIFFKNLMLFIILFFLLLENLKQWRKKNYIFHKFLLERYLYIFSFKKRCQINNVIDMKRDYKHLFYNKNKYITESEMLKTFFKEKYM